MLSNAMLKLVKSDDEDLSDKYKAVLRTRIVAKIGNAHDDIILIFDNESLCSHMIGSLRDLYFDLGKMLKEGGYLSDVEIEEEEA